MSVGGKIKELRMEKGMTMEEFGELIGGVSKASVNNWEKGENLPNKQRLKRIAEIADKGVVDFFGKGILNKKHSSAGCRIKVIRQKLGLNMGEFGEQVENAHKTLVSKWEKGQNLPNSERLKRIAEIGGISVEELLNGKQKEITTNNIKITTQGNKYTIVIKEGNQDRWITVDKDTARELISKLGSALDV